MPNDEHRIGGSDRCLLWIIALIIIACVLFAGEPDLVDALRMRIMPQEITHAE